MANGCGPSWMPDFLKDKYYEDACNEHDRRYEEQKHTRKQVDILFLIGMLNKSDNLLREGQAVTYYCIVRVFGWTSWGAQK